MKYLNQITLLIFIISVVLPTNISAQKKNERAYKFKTVIEIPTTPVKDQQSTGTCWSYATTSFLETELIRMGKDEYDLSEMFFVRNAFKIKAMNYVRRHGEANFSQGGQAHDVLDVIKKVGIVPEEVYKGKKYNLPEHDHGEMEAVIKGILDAVLKQNSDKLTDVWPKTVDAVLDIYMGEFPVQFTHKNNTFGPKSFEEQLGLDISDYIELTSYSHHPYYKKINLEIPDNWSSDLYYNLPVEELMQVFDYAFKNGYSVCWDGDVSSKCFSHSEGIAIVPVDPELDDDEIFSVIRKEKEITQELRQKTFNDFTTTDDHLMHLVGIVQDQEGTKYYVTKNSWNENSNEYGGLLNMSENYVKLNTVAILVHKDAVPQAIREKLDL